MKSRRVSLIHKGHLHIYLPTGYIFTVAAILVLYHSQTGNTERRARAVAQGVAETEDSSVVLRKASMTKARDMRECNAIVICSPEYFGYMAGAVKDLFDRKYEELRDDGEMYKKPFVVVICACNDGTMALSHIERVCKGYQLKISALFCLFSRRITPLFSLLKQAETDPVRP